MGAPVCSVDTPPPAGNPTGKSLPAIPIATDMASLLAAVNAMRQIFHAMLNPQRTGNGGVSGFKTNPNNKKQGRWNEVHRVTAKVKITNPEDKEQFVEVERINSLVMQDSVTGETWIWNR